MRAGRDSGVRPRIPEFRGEPHPPASHVHLEEYRIGLQPSRQVSSRARKTTMKVSYPKMYRVRQRFDVSAVEDVGGVIRREFSRIRFDRTIERGQTVAVAVGSRGIRNLTTIVSTVVECLKNLGLEPFIMPAMGSHGGATGPGQAELLNDLGVNRESVGARVVSNMETVSLGKTDSGAEAFVARDALEADHLVVINRVKPHTAFHSDVESGLCKMLAVGCGKHQGAIDMHKFNLASTIVPAAQRILSRAPVLCGLAIVENSMEQTHTIRLVLPDEFVQCDRELLVTARQLFPKIPIDPLDILVVDEMGKNISGAGIDPNVIGFWRREGGERVPDYRTVIVLDITKESHGNAVGIGMVDLTTRRVVDKINFDASYTNALTTGIWASVKVPITLPDDRQVLDIALSKVADPVQARVVRVVNTLMLEIFWASEALLPELEESGRVEIDESPLQFEFSDAGRLLPL